MRFSCYLCSFVFAAVTTLLTVLPIPSLAAADPNVIDFESLPVPSAGYYNGDINTTGSVRDNFTVNGSRPKFDGTEYLQVWDLFAAKFENNYLVSPSLPGWSGWSWSNVVDPTSPGFSNQYAAWPGGGSDGSGGVDAGGTYAVAFMGSSVEPDGTPLESAVVSFDQTNQLDSVDLANTTYTARYIRDGLDGFGTPDFNAFQQFGNGDFYRLSIAGYDGPGASGSQTGSVMVTLAEDDDFILTGWNTIDLSSLGSVRSLKFTATSSQISSFMNESYQDTPAYVAIDNLRIMVVPEPSTPFWLIATSILAFRRRRRL